MDVPTEQSQVAPNEGSAQPSDRLTSVGAQSLAIYQRQLRDVTTTWFRLFHYSVLLVAALLLLSPADGLDSGIRSVVRWTVPLLIYVVAVARNQRTLRDNLSDLQLFRGVATSQTGLVLRTVNMTGPMLLHQLVFGGTVAVYMFGLVVLR